MFSLGILGRFAAQVFAHFSGLLGGLWGVECFLWRQGATDRRAKGLKVVAMGATGVKGKFGGSGPDLAIWGALLGFFLGSQSCSLYFTFLRLAMSCWAGRAVSSGVCGGKGAPIGGQRVSMPGLPLARSVVKGKLGGPGVYLASLRVFPG